MKITANRTKSMLVNPLISVITVVLNNKKGLELTIESVLGQRYSNIETIIIDGGSTDGSIELIQKFEDRIDYWSSGSDRGIYDAMNRGIEKAGGEWTVFMNSGDVFYSNNTLKDVVSQIEPRAELVYGSFLYVQPEYGNLITIKKPGGLEKLWKGMVFSHQALFVRTSILKRKCFDCSYRYSADYAMVMEFKRRGRKFQKVDDIIAKVSSGGESDVNRLERRLEQINISRMYCGNPGRELYFSCVLSAIRISAHLKRFLPDDFICTLYWIRHRHFRSFISRARRSIVRGQ